MSDETILILNGIPLPAGSSRGISQTLNLISNGEMRRTVNGTLHDVTRQENRKYSSSIRCTDMKTPAFGSLYRGMIVEIYCITPIREPFDYEDGVVSLQRYPVSGSVFGYNAAGQKITPILVYEDEVQFDQPIEFVEYLPIMNMMVIDKSQDSDEYGAVESWQVDLEEV